MIKHSIVALAAAIVAGLTACGDPGTGDVGGSEEHESLGSALECDQGNHFGNAVFEITSPSFAAGEELPAQFTCDGAAFGTGFSPKLEWTKGPKGTKSYAVALIDQSLVGGAFPNRAYHWVIWDVPHSTHALPEQLPSGSLTAPKLEGAQQSGSGYFGPCPNWGATCVPPYPDVHDSYTFTVFALPEHSTETPTGANTRQLIEFFQAEALGSADLPFNSGATPTSTPWPSTACPAQ